MPTDAEAAYLLIAAQGLKRIPRRESRAIVAGFDAPRQLVLCFGNWWRPHAPLVEQGGPLPKGGLEPRDSDLPGPLGWPTINPTGRRQGSTQTETPSHAQEAPLSCKPLPYTQGPPSSEPGQMTLALPLPASQLPSPGDSPSPVLKTLTGPNRDMSPLPRWWTPHFSL